MARGFYFDEEMFNATHSFILSGPIFGIITIVLFFVFFPAGVMFGIVSLIVFALRKSEEGKERSIARMYCRGRSLHDISEHHAIKLSEVRRIVRMGKKQGYIKGGGIKQSQILLSKDKSEPKSSEPTYCTSCGEELPPQSNYCPSCGRKIPKENTK